MTTREFPKIIAHRGHLTDFPENAIGSIKKVLKLTPDYIEIDIGVTKDNKIILPIGEEVDMNLVADDLRGVIGRQIQKLPYKAGIDFRLEGKNLILSPLVTQGEEVYDNSLIFLQTFNEVEQQKR